MTQLGQDFSKTQRTLAVGDKNYAYYSLAAAEEAGLGAIQRLPFSLKILIENLLRLEDGKRTTVETIRRVIDSALKGQSGQEISFFPARVLMQDFTGVPAIVDLAAMRDALQRTGKNPSKINPLIPVDLIIDHSVIVDHYGHPNALQQNVAQEYQRNLERYTFLRWGQKAFQNFRVVPPGTGICHQVNLEYLAQVVWTSQDSDGRWVAYPDTLVGTDSHTTMVNGLGVLGWGVGGIEAEAAMLNQPYSMLTPDVVGFKLDGQLPEGSTATDLVLTITHTLRTKGVVGKFVEFFGPGLDNLTLEERATVANMAPEYGATCAFFPVDQKTLDYLVFTGRDPDRIALVEAYAKIQGLWRNSNQPDPLYAEVMNLDLSSIRPTLAGPKRPQDKVLLEDVETSCKDAIAALKQPLDRKISLKEHDHALQDGDVVIAAITSCTNTSNPFVLLGAGLMARKAREKGLQTKPWVKTSLAPGSQIVTDYLAQSGLDNDLNALGFHLVGYGCTTCIGNSGPLEPEVAKAIDDHDMVVGAVLSGNRNFEARIHPQVKLNYLASPLLVVAYALTGTLRTNLTRDPLSINQQGHPVYLKDIWPSTAEIRAAIAQFMTPDMFRKRYRDVFKGDELWQNIAISTDLTYAWDEKSTYVKNPPYLATFPSSPEKSTDILEARVLALLGDSITTDHISPAGSIQEEGPAGQYLASHHVSPNDFNSYGSRRGNHEVMMRGTLANIRIQNKLTPDRTGGYTRFMPTQETMTIYDAAMRYQQMKIPLVIIAGKEYGTGSSRDWAAKGTRLLGVKAVLVESFERIHRSNLIGMGVLPLEFPKGVHQKSLELTGEETLSITGLSHGIQSKMTVPVEITYANGKKTIVQTLCRIDTLDELAYFTHDGILPYVLKGF